MSTIFFNATMPDDRRRKLLYEGALFVYEPTPSSKEWCEFVQSLCREHFAPHDPREAQFHMPVEDYAAILKELKPKFIHHPQCKEFIGKVLAELGADTQETFFDVPRLRTSTSHNYLTSGLAYAFHPHRDTWYSAPTCQINWWLPVYEIQPTNCLAVHSRYWFQGVKNSSREYNYYRWNKESRAAAANQIKKDTRQQPRPEEELKLEPQTRLICPPGGVILFSAAHMHSSVPNDSGETRISIDFRTVHSGDAGRGIGAPNVDSECTGTTLRDFVMAGDPSVRLPDDVVAMHDSGTEVDGVLQFQP